MANIEWTHMPGFAGESWNPVVGCTHRGAGCLHCYADTLHTQRHKAYVKHGGKYPKNGKPMPAQYAQPFTTVQLMPERLATPLRTRKPTCWFVNSVSDLFHKDVPFEFIAAVYGVMAACPQHRFIVLTKRPERMLEFFEWVLHEAVSTFEDGITEADVYARCALRHPGFQKAVNHDIYENHPPEHPLPNVWLGTSIADQQDADKNIPILLRCPAAVRFVSAEPLLGPVDFESIGDALFDRRAAIRAAMNGPMAMNREQADSAIAHPELDWVITGGESGPNARPCDVAWIRSIVRQCKAAGTACFVKQLGSDPMTGDPMDIDCDLDHGEVGHLLLKDPKGGDPSEWPEDLRVREFPVSNAEGPEVSRG